MKKVITSGLIIFMPWMAFAQKTKTLNVVQMGYLNITAEISYLNNEETPKDTVYYMAGERLPIASGSLQKMYNIMQSAKNMYNEEIGVNLTKYDVRMSLRKPSNLKEVWFHTSNVSSNAYTILTKENVIEIIYRIENYAKHHKVILKEWK